MQIGTGLLGWTERETLDTSIPTIELAYEGLLERIRLMHFGAGPAAPLAAPAHVPPAAGDVMSAFRMAGGSRSK